MSVSLSKRESKVSDPLDDFEGKYKKLKVKYRKVVKDNITCSALLSESIFRIQALERERDFLIEKYLSAAGISKESQEAKFAFSPNPIQESREQVLAEQQVLQTEQSSAVQSKEPPPPKKKVRKRKPKTESNEEKLAPTTIAAASTATPRNDDSIEENM